MTTILPAAIGTAARALATNPAVLSEATAVVGSTAGAFLPKAAPVTSLASDAIKGVSFLASA